ncbi:uncharacterized protein LOC101895481 [Musca domestica]|uniref:Uncharacterized protein LOC101895481 n=1 Tax=Musca domestica TaxID=7370 RepID=A0A9J7CTM6_MUSDO|nr:uncharacterized protein LOC101895481 [Musca domestica]
MEMLTTQSLIIGSFGMAFCLACTAIEVRDLSIKLRRKDESQESHDKQKSFLNLAMYLGGALFSLLLIWGSLKEHRLAIIPALLCVVGALGFTLFYMGYNLIFIPFGHFEVLRTTVPLLGVQVLVFHILASTFGEMRRGAQTFYDRI